MFFKKYLRNVILQKWTGTEALALWNTTVFDPDPYEGVKRMLDEAVNEQNAVKEEEENNIPVQ